MVVVLRAGRAACGWDRGRRPAVAADDVAARQAGGRAGVPVGGRQPGGPRRERWRRPGPGQVNARGLCVAEAPGRRAGVGARRVDARSLRGESEGGELEGEQSFG